MDSVDTKLPPSSSVSEPKTPRSDNNSDNSSYVKPTTKEQSESIITDRTTISDNPHNDDDKRISKRERTKVTEDDANTQYEDSNEISRRLVEYFIIVSCKESTNKQAEYAQRTSSQSIQQHQSSPEHQVADADANARMNMRRAHLDRDCSMGSCNTGESCGSVNTTNTTGDISITSSPSHVSSTIPNNSMSGENCLKKSTSAATSATSNSGSSNTLKNNFIKSINEHKKKLQANTAKINEQKKKMNKNNALGLKHLEKKLEELNLDKTLLKFKSIKLTPSNSSVKEEERKVVNLAIHPSDSSDDSSIDAGLGNDTKQSDYSEEVIRPSSSPTSARTTAYFTEPLLSSPPPHSLLVESASSSLKEEAPAIPDIEAQPTIESITPRGETENIRISQKPPICNREYNDDIGDLVLEPVITSQYPLIDHQDQPLNPMLPQFCHPLGDVIVPLHEYKIPKVHHFVLTDAKGGKLYGTALTVYEVFKHKDSEIEIMSGEEDDDTDDRSDEGQERGYVEVSLDQSPKPGRSRRRSKHHKYYAPRVLCLLSTWPYLSAFRTYLTQLYRLATTTNLMMAPLERYILNICAEVPAPPPGLFELKINILDTDIRFWAPPADQPIPYVSLHYGVLFECLDIGNVLFAWYTLACERKILLVSSQLSLLTVCAEILCSMLFPMKWSHLYIPVLPRFLTPMLDAPVPYLCGVSRENFSYAVRDISDETIVVDLDRNIITMGSGTPDLPKLPHRRKKKLEIALEKHAGDVFWKVRGLTSSQVEQARLSGDENMLTAVLGTADAVWDEKLCTMDDAFNFAPPPDSITIMQTGDESGGVEQSCWDAVQEAFLRFYASMLKDYRRYMPASPTDQESCWRDSTGPILDSGRFKSAEFIQAQLPDFHPFLEELTMTQMFDDYVTRRMYNAGDAPDIKFFDQSVDAKKNRSKLTLKKKETPFLHSANAHRELKCVDAIQPNNANLPLRSRFNTTYDMKQGLYTYPTWPESLDESLYGKPRPIPKMITAEYDRRSALTAMLRAKHGNFEEGRLSGSNNPSPEATAFVLFFVTFSNTIGAEWKMLEKKHAIMGQNLLDSDASIDSSVSGGGVWKPKVNPEWMSGDNFQSLHSALCPPLDTSEDVVHDDESPTCAPDCTNFCTVDPFRNPFAVRTTPEDETTQSNADRSKRQLQEELANEIETARAVAQAQVDYGFNTLKMMRLRKVPTESICYKSLIEACGRCGIVHRAQQIMEIMTRDGMILDSEVYSAYIKAFSNVDDAMPTLSRVTEDTASEFSVNKSSLSEATSSGLSFLNSSQGDTDQSLRSSTTKNSSTKFLDGLSSTIATNKRAWKAAKLKRTKRLSKHRLTKQKDLIVTNTIKTHIEMSSCILEDLYPGISIDTDDSCLKCSRICSEDDIILGWKPSQVRDFSTVCPSCKHKFVAKFTVSCKSVSFEGSQGIGTPLYCDFLSPWVVLREIRSIIANPVGGKADKLLGVKNTIEQVGIDGIINPNWREGTGMNTTLWWNLIVIFRRYKLPYTFLLQGSYNKQLILPTMTD